MIVVDASAIVEVLVGRPADGLAVRLASEQVLHAPHLLDTEVLHVLRRLTTRGDLAPEHAERALALFASLAVDRYAHAPLTERVWDLRSNLSAYDATYVALAETLGATLVTCDARLAGAPGPTALIECYAP